MDSVRPEPGEQAEADGLEADGERGVERDPERGPDGGPECVPDRGPDPACDGGAGAGEVIHVQPRPPQHGPDQRHFPFDA